VVLRYSFKFCVYAFVFLSSKTEGVWNEQQRELKEGKEKIMLFASTIKNCLHCMLYLWTLP